MEHEEAEAIARRLLDNNIMFSTLDERDREHLVRDMILELRDAWRGGRDEGYSAGANDQAAKWTAAIDRQA